MKKKILLLVRRSYLEIEYILSVLKILKDYEIYAYIENDLALKSLKKGGNFFKEFKNYKEFKSKSKNKLFITKSFFKNFTLF